MSQFAPEGNSVGVAISRRHYHQSSEMEAIAIYPIAGLFNRPWAAFPTMVPASFCLKVEAMQISILAMSRDYTSWYAPRGNSVGVAISQPRVEVRSASTLGIIPHPLSNSTGVALSRRRYHQPSKIEAILLI